MGQPPSKGTCFQLCTRAPYGPAAAWTSQWRGVSNPFQPILIPKHMWLPWPKELTPSGSVSLIRGTPTCFQIHQLLSSAPTLSGQQLWPSHILSTSISPGRSRADARTWLSCYLFTFNLHHKRRRTFFLPRRFLLVISSWPARQEERAFSKPRPKYIYAYFSLVPFSPRLEI